MTSPARTHRPATNQAAGTGARPQPGELPPWASFDPVTTRDHIAYRAATDPDIAAWLRHVAPAGACARPIRLAGRIDTIEARTEQLLATVDTASMPDGLIYKACGNRRASVCPSCSRVYQRDAYQILKSMLVGGKGVPATVSLHDSVFSTFTAPSFGPVHHRVVSKHTCADRRRCDCRAEPCRPRRDTPTCPHGRPLVCWVRHDPDDRDIGQPLCLDCYDHDHHVVWNLYSGELWRRTKQDAERYLAALARARSIPFVYIPNPDGKTFKRKPPVQLAHGKAAEFQARGVVHFHALIRLDGLDPTDPAAVIQAPPGITGHDVEAALRYAAAHIAFTTPPHPDKPEGWRIAWGDPNKGLDVAHLTLTGDGEITDAMAASYRAGYLAKYATKSTEATGFQSARLDAETIKRYADPQGDHNARLLAACWRLGRTLQPPSTLSRHGLHPGRAKTLGPRWTCPTCGTPTRLRVCLNCSPSRQENPDTTAPSSPRPTTKPDPGSAAYYGHLRRWAHMLGFGGHFLTKARRGVPLWADIRADRANWRRTNDPAPADQVVHAADHTEETTLIVGSLTFAGVGWHNTGDAALAATSAAMARARRRAARDALTTTST